METTCSTDTFVADNPEALLSLIHSGQCQIVEDGIVNAPAYDIEVQRNVSESRQGIFSANGPLPTKGVKKSKTSNRILTTGDVIDEKKENELKMLKEKLKAVRKQKRENIK